MKKYLAILVSLAILTVALVAISGCAPKAQTSSQPTVQAPATATPAPATATPAPATATPAPAVATPSTGTNTTSTTTTTTTTTSKPKASSNQFEAYIQSLPAKFIPSAASGVTCTYQMNVTSGADMGLYWIKIANGTCTVGDGAVANPTLTINTPEQLWFGLVAGTEDGTADFLAGKYSAAPMGNIKYLQNMASYFTK